MMILLISNVIFIQSSSVEAVMPEYLPVNRVLTAVLSRSVAIENYLSLQLDLWETIREVHTFGTNRKIQAALWQRERERERERELEVRALL